MEKDNKNIEIILEKQLKQGANNYIDDPGVEIPKKAFEFEELNVSMFLVDSLLNSNGYKTPIQSDFNKNIKLKLNRIIDNNSDKQFLYINFFNKCDRDFNYFPNNGVDYNGIYIDKVRKIISKFYYIPELIDYQKNYPNVSKIENQVQLHYSLNENNYTIELWKDLDSRNDDYSLSKQRKFNQQLLISRNKYLFNDDQSQFAWLINNDKYFMRSLVTTFGYTEDKKLLKWVIENTELPYFDKNAKTENLKDLSKLIWTKDCNGNIRVHQNTLDLIKELSTPDDNLYIKYIAEYISNYMVSFPFKEEELTIEQQAKIAAYILYWGEQYKYDKQYNYNQMFMTRFYNYNYQKDLYEKEFIKNNYYGLPKFKEWYEAAKKEKDYFNGGKGMEDDPQPSDYESRAKYIK
ncbi:hypothetical protein [Apibacter sp. HY039]|uniref:hypothetical protein n=1 Tax=Apibacter sp. HY039 TaxID=2501476 RepID=UPI000FEBB80E|nr:hypothetical protein [Apibacter sp. HY039]